MVVLQQESKLDTFVIKACLTRQTLTGPTQDEYF